MIKRTPISEYRLRGVAGRARNHYSPGHKGLRAVHWLGRIEARFAFGLRLDFQERKWKITRTILPIVSLPAFAPGQGGTSGIGDVQISAFLSPAKPGAWIWGAGVVTQLPTHRNDALGNNNAGLGPQVKVGVGLDLNVSSPFQNRQASNSYRWRLRSGSKVGGPQNTAYLPRSGASCGSCPRAPWGQR
jgi:hypothetical protein